MLKSQLDSMLDLLLLWFNRDKCRENTSLNIMCNMIMGFARWSKQHSLVTNTRANVVSKLVACHQHQKELVQCHKMCLPDLQSLYPSCSSWGATRISSIGINFILRQCSRLFHASTRTTASGCLMLHRDVERTINIPASVPKRVMIKGNKSPFQCVY